MHLTLISCHYWGYITSYTVRMKNSYTLQRCQSRHHQALRRVSDVCQRILRHLPGSPACGTPVSASLAETRPRTSSLMSSRGVAHLSALPAARVVSKPSPLHYNLTFFCFSCVLLLQQCDLLFFLKIVNLHSFAKFEVTICISSRKVFET